MQSFAQSHASQEVCDWALTESLNKTYFKVKIIQEL